MLVAKELIKKNIVEYLLYMYQVEDLIRACKLENDLIETHLVNKYEVEEATKTEIRSWYFGLVDLMEEEKIQTVGHLSFITNKINEINEFHLYLMQSLDFSDYNKEFKLIEPILAELASKHKEAKNAIQLIIDAVYGVYLLRLKKQEVSKTTLDSITQLTSIVNKLSSSFKRYESGDLKIE